MVAHGDGGGERVAERLTLDEIGLVQHGRGLEERSRRHRRKLEEDTVLETKNQWLYGAVQALSLSLDSIYNSLSPKRI